MDTSKCLLNNFRKTLLYLLKAMKFKSHISGLKAQKQLFSKVE